VIGHYLEYADERLRSAYIIKGVLESHVIPEAWESCGSLSAMCSACESIARSAISKVLTIRLAIGSSHTLRAAWRRALKEGKVSQVPYFPITKEDNARQGFLEEAAFLGFLECAAGIP
jgi:hypothetical protein